MKVLIVGQGVQGEKRKKYLGKDFFAYFDPFNQKSDFKKLENIPEEKYDTVMLCVPDKVKIKLINYFVNKRKNILIEKPLLANRSQTLKNIEKKSISNKVFTYVAYNHRFEPHYKNIKKIIKKNKLGKIYSLRIFYGNGTSKLVKKSNWRDSGLGVISDIGSHLLDLCIFFFGSKNFSFKKINSNFFENKSPDHAVLLSRFKKIHIQLEMTLCMWKNNMDLDLIFEKGSVHMNNLCKWGPSKLTIRKRVYPSGKPLEKNYILNLKDPTWLEEYKFFKKSVKNKKKTDLSNDIWINNQMKKFREKN
ncbi:Gfo/Idh/MocA family protein [Candidatus Pelagibacter sp.]|uniref:Gfo/Idh/MocA family protein n=1 Tax=Candidatus Pelagibacter sp. TaxID=2024849 RepID=UPI003D11DF1C